MTTVELFEIFVTVNQFVVTTVELLEIFCNGQPVRDDNSRII